MSGTALQAARLVKEEGRGALGARAQVAAAHAEDRNLGQRPTHAAAGRTPHHLGMA